MGPDDCVSGLNHFALAGGQAKRTNIGIALVSDPRVLFLDEPTSGLDSYTANEVLHLSCCTSSVALEKHVVRLSNVKWKSNGCHCQLDSACDSLQ